MSSEVIRPNLPNDWKVEQLRLSIFVNETPDNPRDIWTNLLDGPPDTEQTERNGTVSTYQASGNVGAYTLTLRIEPNRIDWTVGTPPGPVVAPFGMPIGNYVPTAREFIDLVKPFLMNDALSVIRMAFGALLSFPVANRQEGYGLLNTLLPSVTLDQNSSDFFYRINRRRHASSFSIDINRLSEWLVLELLPLPFVFGQIQGINPGAVIPNPVTSVSTFAARLQLDINTSPEQPLMADPTQRVALIDEILAYANEIAEAGDMP